MDQNLSNALTRATGILTAVLVLIGVHQAVQTYYLVNPQAKAPEEATFDVSGTGKTVVTPDVAKLTVSVVTQSETSAAATDGGNQTMSAVNAALKALGVADADLKTSSYQMNPRYDYSKNRNGEIVGYDLNQSLTVTVRDVTKVASLIDAATEAGANAVSGPSFEIDDPEAAKAEAREEAFKHAKEQAEQLAKAAGVRLGDIVKFSESSSDGSGPVYYAEKAMDTTLAAAPSIEAGSNEINVTVDVTYAISN